MKVLVAEEEFVELAVKLVEMSYKVHEGFVRDGNRRISPMKCRYRAAMTEDLYEILQVKKFYTELII